MDSHPLLCRTRQCLGRAFLLSLLYASMMGAVSLAPDGPDLVNAPTVAPTMGPTPTPTNIGQAADEEASAGTAIGVLFAMAAGVGLYFVPTIVALRRQQQVGPVIVLNFFLGWTVIGWIVALAWALQDRREATSVIVQQQVTGGSDPSQHSQQTVRSPGDKPPDPRPGG